MKCPHCNAWSDVLETRTRTDETKRRRYQCANMHRFSTNEHVIEDRSDHKTPAAPAKEAVPES